MKSKRAGHSINNFPSPFCQTAPATKVMQGDQLITFTSLDITLSRFVWNTVVHDPIRVGIAGRVLDLELRLWMEIGGLVTLPWPFV